MTFVTPRRVPLPESELSKLLMNYRQHNEHSLPRRRLQQRQNIVNRYFRLFNVKLIFDF